MSCVRSCTHRGLPSPPAVSQFSWGTTISLAGLTAASWTMLSPRAAAKRTRGSAARPGPAPVVVAAGWAGERHKAGSGLALRRLARFVRYRRRDASSAPVLSPPIELFSRGSPEANKIRQAVGGQAAAQFKAVVVRVHIARRERHGNDGFACCSPSCCSQSVSTCTLSLSKVKRLLLHLVSTCISVVAGAATDTCDLRPAARCVGDHGRSGC
jgi:hypothetical protein